MSMNTIGRSGSRASENLNGGLPLRYFFSTFSFVLIVPS
jgi:hypothetical protein